LHVIGRGARTYACGRSFAVLSTQVSTVILRARHSRLACGSVLEVIRDAVAAGEEQLASCAAEQIKYFSICAVTLCPCGDFASLNSCYAACGCGAEYRCGALPWGDVWRYA
jgi:hypothetical protein